MYTAFLAVARACGTPAMLAALALGQVSNLMGCLTTYGIGSAPPYFGAGYVPQADWLKVSAMPWKQPILSLVVVGIIGSR